MNSSISYYYCYHTRATKIVTYYILHIYYGTSITGRKSVYIEILLCSDMRVYFSIMHKY